MSQSQNTIVALADIHAGDSAVYFEVAMLDIANQCRQLHCFLRDASNRKLGG